MTPTTRRSVLRAGAAALVLAPFAATRAAFGAAASRDLYTRVRFRRWLRSSFRVVGRTEEWRMRLVRVSNLPAAPDGASRRFALTFRSRVPGPPQGSYVFQRKGFTPTTLFVVPSDPERRTYQAIVSSQA
jgi:uncharacterized protein DUF6916